MKLLAVSINGILDLKNMLLLSKTLLARHSINLDVSVYRSDLADAATHYDGLIVGSDWNANSELVSAFKAKGKATILVQSEGLFVDPDHWYMGKAPQTDLACLWGPIHKTIFLQRGYAGTGIVTGPPRFDIYHKFQPEFTKEECYDLLGLSNLNRPFVLFLCQHFPKNEWGDIIAQNQMDFTRFATNRSENYTPVLKIHPQESPEYFTERLQNIPSDANDYMVVTGNGSSSEPIDIDSLLYYSAGAVSFSSTALFEALLLKRPAGVYTGNIRSPLEDGRISKLQVVNNLKDVDELIAGSVDVKNLSGFIGGFVPSIIDGKNTARCAYAIASFMAGKRMEEELVAPAKTEIMRTKTANSRNEAEVENRDVSAYKALAIGAYTKLAENLNRMNTVERIKRIKESLITPAQIELKDAYYYQELHSNDYGYQNNNWLVSELETISKLHPESLLEIGCGNGRFISAIAETVPKVIGVDFAKSPMISNLPSNVNFLECDVIDGSLPTANLVCSADVLEHFPFEIIRDVLRKILNAGPLQYHIIACYDDGHSHATILQPGEWLSLFQEFDKNTKIIDLRPRRNDPNQIVCVLSNCVGSTS